MQAPRRPVVLGLCCAALWVLGPGASATAATPTAAVPVGVTNRGADVVRPAPAESDVVRPWGPPPDPAVATGLAALRVRVAGVSQVVPWARAAAPAPWPHPVALPAQVANPRTGWGPSLATVAEAEAAVARMSLTERAGQVLVATYAGTDPDDAAEVVARWGLAGVILMADNVEDADQVAATAAAVQEAVADDGRVWPGIVAVDEEGGRVSRLAGVIDTLPAFAAFGAAEPATTWAEFARLGADLAGLGITMDLAPVADVTIGADDPTIGDRSASADPDVVAAAARAAGGGLRDGGVVPVLKHFPGHGSVTADSHVELPVQAASLARLAAWDLVPFRAGIDAGAPVVMMGHLDVHHLDPGVPASSSSAAHRLLREDLGFDGVVVTDAMGMGAVPRTAPGEEVVAAVAAGADLVLMPRDVGAARSALVTAVRDGRLPPERLREAATRVVALQLWSMDL